MMNANEGGGAVLFVDEPRSRSLAWPKVALEVFPGRVLCNYHLCLQIRSQLFTRLLGVSFGIPNLTTLGYWTSWHVHILNVPGNRVMADEARHIEHSNIFKLRRVNVNNKAIVMVQRHNAVLFY